MKKFLLYGHGGSYNHGAEAIVKTTIQIIRRKVPNAYIILSSHFPEQDKEFKIEVDEIYGPDTDIWVIEKKVTEPYKRRELARDMYANVLNRIKSETICLSVGGDVFCYNNWHRLAVFQEKITKVRAKSFLWGCSVESLYITSEMLVVLQSYTKIFARESKTYNTLKKHGLNNVILNPDPAFLLEPSRFIIYNKYKEEHTIGINISPLIIGRESKSGIIIENIKLLIKYITMLQGYNIMLIPHVMMPADNDYILLSVLYNELSEDEKSKVFLLDKNLSAAEYKYAVSKCSLLICARTHTSIAAYSLGIPTLVLGYSIKSHGIAYDLKMENYVIDVKEIIDSYALKNAFIYMIKNYDKIKNRLINELPEYKKNIESKYGIF